MPFTHARNPRRATRFTFLSSDLLKFLSSCLATFPPFLPPGFQASQPLSLRARRLTQPLEGRRKGFGPGFRQQGIFGDDAGTMLRGFGAFIQLFDKCVPHPVEMLLMS